MKPSIEFIPYGEISSRLSHVRWRRRTPHARISKSRQSQAPRRIFVTFSHDLDQRFVKMFRQRATPQSRLLIVNEGSSTDRLVSRIMDMQIRTPQRCYVLETRSRSGSAQGTTFLDELLERLALPLQGDGKKERILDARLESEILHVVSPGFDRLHIPIRQIPELKGENSSKIHEFEIDEDGSFIYWPELDVHLDWARLQQLVDPEAALKSSQKTAEFNKRYGKAVQTLRQQAALKRSEVPGLSEKQVSRIERGECRLTSNAIRALAKAHRLAPNNYMNRVAEALEPMRQKASG